MTRPLYRGVFVLFMVAGCSEFRVTGRDPVPAAAPPERLPDAQGEPPSDWNACASGFLGRYFNLEATHPDVALLAPADPETVDWFDDERIAFSRYDPTLEFGENWWPVDNGIDGDPEQFAAQWTAWLRVRSNTSVDLLLGAADDAWVWIGDERVATQTDAEVLTPQVYTISLRPGVYPIEIRYAHRLATSAGLRFRVVGGEAELCYPEFDDE
ncbi:MAG: hypothetical protein ACJAZO_003710 [Myxococcota bacterium]|jgi:hypothetical protein